MKNVPQYDLDRLCCSFKVCGIGVFFRNANIMS